MKRSIFFVLLILGFSNLYSSPITLPHEPDVESTQDELARLDLLIQVSQENIEREKNLRALVVQYRECEANCIKNPNDSQRLVQLIACAKKLHGCIEESYLQDYFRPQFLEELKKLVKVADKKEVPPVR